MDVECDAGGGTESARSERPLRSMLRHERVAVAMAVAEATHHSSRGQKSGTVTREEEVHELYGGPRAQKRPPPGERPGILAEPGPQRSDRTVRRFAGDGLPTLGLLVLAGASGEALDATSLLPHGQGAGRHEEGGGSRTQLTLQRWSSVRCCCSHRSARRPRRSAGLTNSTSFFTSSGARRKRKKRRRKRKRRAGFRSCSS